MRKPRSIRIDRDIWDGVIGFLARLEANPDGESVPYFQGGAQAILDNIKERQPRAMTAVRTASEAAELAGMIGRKNTP